MTKLDEDIPEDRLCRCGYRYSWFEVDPDPDRSSVFFEIQEEAGFPHLRMREDVVERPCPHGNGTVVQYCPSCDRQVGMWGCGVAGGMECDCWDSADSPPWWERFLRFFH